MPNLYLLMLSTLAIATGMYFYPAEPFFGVILLIIGIAGAILTVFSEGFS